MGDIDKLLEELGLDGIPSQETLLRDIEEQVLVPKAEVPEHWLSTYQMLVSPAKPSLYILISLHLTLYSH